MKPGNRRGPARFLEPETFSRVEAVVSAEALSANYDAIRARVPGLSLLPMIKANAYGHGGAWAARVLAQKPDLYAFGVATLEEGAEAREALGPRGRRTRILVFAGVAPWSEEKGQYCEAHALAPVISTDEDWRAFERGGWPARLSYELKFNTGMNRLGLSTRLAPQLARSLAHRPGEEQPSGILTHLAVGENPDARLSRDQLERFTAIRSELAPVFPAAHFHFANSAGIWNARHWRLSELSDVVRPGLSLYGVPPWPGAPERGLAPVLTLRALVVDVHRLKSGDTVGYGARFTAPKAETTHVAMLALGYGDGLHRRLSGGLAGDGAPGGFAWLGGRERRFLGAISMDLAAIECDAGTKPGEWAELLGPRVDHWAQAKAAGTIPYELLTSIAPRVKRLLTTSGGGPRGDF
jgi:alanine racemase